MTWSLIILEGGGVEGERKQKDREGAGKERRARITMASMRRANREMREYQGGQIIRERPSYFASSHSHPCQHFMRHGIIHSPLPSPRFIPVAYFVRIVILPIDSKVLLEIFRMILEWLIDVCCCVIFDRLEINRSFSLCFIKRWKKNGKKFEFFYYFSYLLEKFVTLYTDYPHKVRNLHIQYVIKDVRIYKIFSRKDSNFLNILIFKWSNRKYMNFLWYSNGS